MSAAPVENITAALAPEQDTTDDTPFVVHLLATPRWSVAAKFHAVLQRTLAEAPDVQVTLSGAAKSDSHLELTFAISMGPAATVSKWSPESVAGFNLVYRLMDELIDYTPRFVGAPDDDRAQAAVALAPAFGLTATVPAAAARAA